MSELQQPKYKFGSEVEYAGITFKVTNVVYRENVNDRARPNGYYYQDTKGYLHHEDAIKRYLPPVTPITKDEFFNQWSLLYGCTWDNYKSANTLKGLIAFLKEKGLLVEE